MKRQFIAAIDSAFFLSRKFGNGVHRYPLERLYKEVEPNLVLRQREALESDPVYRQILPYKIIMQYIDGQNKIVAYRRLNGGGESRLHGLMSIGFGGHIDLEDVVFENSVVDLETTVRNGSRREIAEEVYTVINGVEESFVPKEHEVIPANLFIHYSLRDKLGDEWSVEKDVHSVHIAFVYTIFAEPHLKLIAGESDKIEMLEPMTPHELLHSGMEMEEWTRLLLEHLVTK